MKPIILELNNNSSTPLYVQLYQSIKSDITTGSIKAGERLPSLRSLSQSLGISITTVQLAYNQLLVEGYTVSRPQSGYYVSQTFHAGPGFSSSADISIAKNFSADKDDSPYIHDSCCFDFNKWKKCSSAVFNQYANRLLYESDPQGEKILRSEISKYLYSSRGVKCSPKQIVIGAGTQQITGQLCRILDKLEISHVSLESPGYLPVQNMFRDNGFAISHIPVHKDGIDISRLPVNISSAVYVSPSNQFPTGAVMPAGRRYQLLEWAKTNDSIIIEDDYDSELRYFGKPVPALQSLDSTDSVVYLGSFSSTLFPAIKISYMVLPPAIIGIFDQIRGRYTQTCSKAEQLTLALFMEKGFYNTGIKKLRNLYSQKLQASLLALSRYGHGKVKAVDTQSGINLILRIRSSKNAEELCSIAKSIGVHMVPVADISDQETSALIFYYNSIPLKEIDGIVKALMSLWELAPQT